MIYEYKTLDNRLKSVSSHTCFAMSEEDLKCMVKAKDLILISFKRKKTSNLSNLFTVENFALPFFTNINTLISNKIDIINALTIVLDSFSKIEHKAVIQYLIYKITEGSSLHRSMEKLTELRVFDKISIKTVQIAEQTATLKEAFTYIIKYLGDNIKIKKMLRGSMLYPVVLLTVMFFVTSFWIFFIIPTFAGSFSDMGMNIPSITVALLHFRFFIITHKLLVFLILSLSFILIRHYKTQILSKIPVVKIIKRNLQMLRFFNSMSLMLHEKVNFLEAIEFSMGLTKDKKLDLALLKIIEQTKQGLTISEAFGSTGIFASQEISMIRSGESVGDMAGVFQVIANTLQNSTENTISKLQSMIQPASTIVMGLLLLIVVCSIFLPMYDQLGSYI